MDEGMSNQCIEPMVVYHFSLSCVCDCSTHQIRSRWGGSVAWLGLVVSFGWIRFAGASVCSPGPNPDKIRVCECRFFAPSLLFVFGVLCTLKIAWDILAC
jgi:hypothetical protein